MNNHAHERRVAVRIQVSKLEIPPVYDALMIGRHGPLGPVAAQKMLEATAPGQFDLIRVDGEVVEAVLLRKSLFQVMPRERLVALILDETAELLSPGTLLKVKLDLEVAIHTEVQI